MTLVIKSSESKPEKQVLQIVLRPDDAEKLDTKCKDFIGGLAEAYCKGTEKSILEQQKQKWLKNNVSAANIVGHFCRMIFAVMQSLCHLKFDKSDTSGSFA